MTSYALRLVQVLSLTYRDSTPASTPYFCAPSPPLPGRVLVLPQDVNPKNIATSLKSPKFLDFFWRRLRPAPVPPPSLDVGDYPYLSPCQGERNFVRAADKPVVFHAVEGGELIWGGELRQGFDPEMLAVSGRTGR